VCAGVVRSVFGESDGASARVLVGLLGLQCELYNAALEDRRGAWRWSTARVLCGAVPDAHHAACHSPGGAGLRVTGVSGDAQASRLAFAGFYRRCRAGQRPGFPRFRSRGRWDSLQWEDRPAGGLDEASRRLHLMGIGGFETAPAPPIRGIPKRSRCTGRSDAGAVTIRCVERPRRTRSGVSGALCKRLICLGVCVIISCASTRDVDAVGEVDRETGAVRAAILDRVVHFFSAFCSASHNSLSAASSVGRPRVLMICAAVG